MSLFGISLIGKETDRSRSCVLEKRRTEPQCSGGDSKAAEEVTDSQFFKTSQFFIKECGLWDEDDDSEVFVAVKLKKKKKKSPKKCKDPMKKSKYEGKNLEKKKSQKNTTSPSDHRETKPSPAEEEEKNEKDKQKDKDHRETNPSPAEEEEKNEKDKQKDKDHRETKPSPAEEEEKNEKDKQKDKDHRETKPSPAEEEEKNKEDKLDFEIPDYDEISYAIACESIEDNPWLASPKAAPASTTFRLSHEPSQPTKKCTESKKNDSDSSFRCQVNDSCVDKGEGEEKTAFYISKELVNPLGLAEATNQWVSTLLQNEALANVSSGIPAEKLQANLIFLNKSYVEIMEKVVTAFENLPLDLLSQFPEFDPYVFLRLRSTRRRIRAIVIKTENFLKRGNLNYRTPEERKRFEWQSESDLSRQRKPLYIANDGDKSFNFQQRFISESKTPKSNFSSPSFGYNNSLTSRKLNFPVVPSPNTETFSRSGVGLANSSTPMPSGPVEKSNSDVTFTTPEKSSQWPDMNTINNCTSGEFNGLNFPHSEEVVGIFQEKFGLKAFRPNQLQVINAALLGHDCFVLMPTGGGKSLCYQLPALVSKGVTIVISPLRSLIQDQVTKLLMLDIAAAHLSGDIKEYEAMSVYSKLNQWEPKLKLLYVTPEKVGSSSALRNCLMDLYRRKMLARFVIDEAHCVSQWGHDFRPDYKKLRELRENFPDVKIIALTATATPRVRKDILHQLKVEDPKLFLSSFNRSNLMYSVKEKKGNSIVKDIAMFIQNEFNKDSGVIYCLSRKECEFVAKDLNKYGVKATAYHAGMSDEQRNTVQNLWMNDKIRVVCATVAFGMGIDKLDVRYVIHYSLPKSIEGYYQESGRAGRDGEKAVCVLYYSYRDKLRLLKLINENEGSKEAKKVHFDNLFQVVAFAENKTDCRRALQLEYFGERFDRKYCLQNRNTACDNCLSQGLYETIDATAESQAIVSAVKDVCGTGERRKFNFTMLHFVDVFKGSLLKKIISEGHNKLPLYGMGKSWQRIDAERLFRKLVMEEFLKERLQVQDEGITFAYISVGRRGEELLNGNVRITFEVKKARGSAVAQPLKVRTEGPATLEIQEKCYNDLTDAIHQIASSMNCSANSIMKVQTLRAMSSRLPETPEEMLSISHMTMEKFEKYGSILLEITAKYAAQKKAVQPQEVAEEDGFARKFAHKDREVEDSPYFDTEIEYVGRGRGGGKRKRGYRKAQKPSKKFKGNYGQSSGRWGDGLKSGWPRGRGGAPWKGRRNVWESPSFPE